MHSDTTYKCFSCGSDIVDHVFLVQRRKVRPVTEKSTPEDIDAVQTWHGGIILGPESDPYCSTCYDSLPTIQELLDDYKSKLDLAS